MSEHRHRWQRPVTVTLVCKCGAEGQACEACEEIHDIASMHTASEGLYFCDECWSELLAEWKKNGAADA